MYYDIKSNYDTNSIVIQNNSFSSSAYGIAFSTTTNALATTGPTYVRMINNKFQDIFNEGIDIPKINQLIMLRPTESAIIFTSSTLMGSSYLSTISIFLFFSYY